MKFIKLTTTDPYYNLAVEEYLLARTCEDVFMLWQNSPTVVIGKNQNAYAEVDIDYARANGINICRRITGGGAVYHDAGNINYSYISSSDRSLDYEYFSRPIISALSSMGIKCSLGGRNDILVGEKKISGNAQHSSNGRILHHGTLLFSTNVYEMERVLKTDREKLEHNGVRSHKSRVANLSELLPDKMTVNEFVDTLEIMIKNFFNAEEMLFRENDEVIALFEKNKNPDWILSSKKHLIDFTLKQKKRYPCGSVYAQVTLERDIIKKITLSGDFFTLAPIEELEQKLAGKSRTDFGDVNVSDYIVGMTNDELKDLITN